MKRFYLLQLILWTGCFSAIPLLCISQTGNIIDERVTTASNIGATINNLGIVGNSFTGSFNVEGAPSLEFPANSGVEHIFEGGLWVGGSVNGQIAVSTGAIDDPRGYSPGKSGFEFTSETSLAERSTLFDSPFFGANGISHQDFVSTFTDTSLVIRTGTGRIPIANHTSPLGIQVDFESYNWNFSFANFFIILNFTITNLNDVPIDSLYAGYWIDAVVRNVNITPPGGSAFFNKGGNGYVDSLHLAYEFDAAGDLGFTDTYLGLQYLGADQDGSIPNSPNFDVHFNTWQFLNSADPRFFFPSQDLQRFGKLKSGINLLPDWPAIQRSISSPNNRSLLVSAGPFDPLFPGESVTVAFALVCARRAFDGNPPSADTDAQRTPLLQHAGWARTAFLGEDRNGNGVLDGNEDVNGNGTLDEGEDINANGRLDLAEDRDGNGQITRYVLPEPPPVPNVRVEAKDHQMIIYWSDNAESAVDPISNEVDFEGYRLYKTAVGFDVQNTQDILQSLELIQAWDSSDNQLFFDTGFESIRLEEAVTFEGDTNKYIYQYTFDNIANGWQHIIAVTAFDRGDPENNLVSLESTPLGNVRHVFAGTPANADLAEEPFVYPNPYYARASWEGASTFEEDRKIIFANLPARAQIKIYTISGDLVDSFEHDESYDGADIKWFDTFSNPDEAVFSGGEHAWDLLSANNQIISRGLYVFVVTDRDTGQKYRGNFVLIK